MEAVKTLYRADVPAIVFTLDDGYVPYFSVVLAGIIFNSAKDKLYDIVVLSTNISSANQKKLDSFCKKFPNVSLRFFDIGKLIENEKRNMVSNIAHINEVAFYRLYIPSIFRHYKKVIYLDCDLCVDADISELYNIDLGNNYLAAAKWMFAVSKDNEVKISYRNFDATQYTYETLSVPVEDYFNAGVLIFNVSQIMKDKKHLEFIDKIKESHKFMYNDQDILNICCHKRVKYLGTEWNFTRQFENREAVLAYDDMLNSRIKIYHYVGKDKPWLCHDKPYYNIYYMYASLSPYNDVLLG